MFLTDTTTLMLNINISGSKHKTGFWYEVGIFRPDSCIQWEWGAYWTWDIIRDDTICCCYCFRCLKAYDVEFSTKSSTGPFKKINTKDSIFTSLVYAPTANYNLGMLCSILVCTTQSIANYITLHKYNLSKNEWFC